MIANLLKLELYNNMQPEEIKQLIEANLTNAEAIVDGDGAHFLAIVISPDFVGKSRIQKQQMVYATVNAELINGKLHALSVKAYTPEEWEKSNNKEGI